MSNNLIITYDLIRFVQNYKGVEKKIMELGKWAKFQRTTWYVKSNLTAEQACKHIMKAVDGNDKIFVVNATDNSFCSYGMDPKISKPMIAAWDN